MTRDTFVKCTRCRFQHREAERVLKPRPRQSTATLRVSDTCCPRCNCKSFYDMRPQVAWCWASGLIEIGDAAPANSADGRGPIVIATGPKYALKPFLDVVARHGKGESSGLLLVPGVPEAEDPLQAAGALRSWIDWCAKSKSCQRDGIQFS
ncbi:hypothetical protein [Pandoraea pnomenusa]|uniref:hypothetical protein n=1 Tax=Pandoraea pnomenusa TaxID=93220 RepID=UPI00333EB9EF